MTELVKNLKIIKSQANDELKIMNNEESCTFMYTTTTHQFKQVYKSLGAPWSVIVSLTDFISLVSQFDEDENISFSATSQALFVTTETSKYTLPCLTQFKDFLEQDYEVTAKIPYSVFSSLKKGLDLYSINKPSKLIQNYIYIDNTCACIYVEGFLLNRHSIEDKFKLLLDNKDIKLFDIFSDFEELTVKYNDIFALFTAGDTSLILNIQSQIVDQFPLKVLLALEDKYEQFEVEVDFSKVIKALNRLNVVDKKDVLDKYRTSILDITKDNIKLESKTAHSFENIECKSTSDETLNYLIRFNDLTKFLKVLPNPKLYGTNGTIIILKNDNSTLFIPTLVS